MSLENEDTNATNHVSEIGDEVRKHPKVSYTREFLLSLSQLEICQKLPTGFDQLILSELEDSSRGIQDRQKIHGNLSSQGFRRNDYSSSPPTRGDSDGNSRGIYGRWESRSSGRSDRDSDSQSDKDSDQGRRYGNQARRTWQSSEHDGLLGSGSFPRPSVYASGMAATKARPSDSYQLNRSSEPYHPPRPYKAVPHSRRNTDACNDETFGSIECASEDRVEEERKRRASFELMRKEQQKALQEKHKPNAEKHTAEYDSEISVLLEDDKKDRGLLENTNVDVMTSQPVVNNDSGKSSSSSQNLPSRPLVPPGFKTTVTDKTSGSTTSNHSCLTEIGKHETEEILLEAKANAQIGIHQSLERQSSQEISSSGQPEHKSLHASVLKKNDQIVNLSVASDDSDRKHSMGKHSIRTSSLEGHEALNEPSILELSAQNKGKFVKESNINNSTSILDKIFGSAIANLTDSVTPVMNESSKPSETLDCKAVPSSKFAHWFSEEERQQEDDPSSSRPSDLLALIGGGDKNRTQPFEANASDQFPSEFSYHSSDPTSKFVSNLPSSPLGGTEPMYKPSKREAAPTILTCEDLEHTMLCEFSEKKSNSQPQGWSTNHAKPKEPVIVDSKASQHLLSLLQKRPDNGNVTLKSDAGIESLEAHGDITVQDRPKKEDNKDTLTLESLFGTAFMTELQSAQAPVSVQRVSVGSGLNVPLEAQKSSLPGSDDTLPSSIIDDIGFRGATTENIVLPSNCGDHTKMDKAENWLGGNDSLFEVNSLGHQTEVVSRNGDYRAGGFHLPEGESLFSVGDPLGPQVSTFMPAGNTSKGDLVTVNSVGSDQMTLMGPGALSFPRASHDQIESEMLFHHLHAQPSSSRFHPLQMNQGKPLLHPLDSRPAHLNTQILTGPEGIARHDALPGHQFAGNMMRPPLYHPNARLTGFDLPAHHPMLQQMPMSGPHTPHLLNDHPSGGPVPSHSSNQAAGFVHEANRMQGFPFKPHQVNINGLGMQMPGPDINSQNNHPDALQRLIEMELRASKQIHPFPAGRGQGMYGHELDMGLRHR